MDQLHDDNESDLDDPEHDDLELDERNEEELNACFRSLCD